MHYQAGLVALAREDWPGAIDHLKRAPRTAESLYYLAQAYHLRTMRREAMETIRAAAALAPRHAHIQQKLGQFLCETVRCDEGVKHLLRARELNPELDRIDFEVGMAWYRIKRLPEARDAFGAALKRNPGDAESAFFLAETRTQAYEYEEARTAYERALAIRPKDPRALLGLGRTLLDLERPAEALPVLERCLEVDPGRADARFQLGRALRALGREEEGMREMELFARVKERLALPNLLSEVRTPEEQRLWEELKTILERGDERAAETHLESAFARFGLPRQDTRFLIGSVYLGMDRAADAVRVLEAAARKPGTQGSVRAFLGYARLQAKDATGAERELRAVLDSEPDNRLALAWLGELRAKAGQYAEAIRLLESARPSQPSFLLRLVDAYLKTGDREGAKQTAEMLRVLAAGDKQVMAELDRMLGRS